MFRRILVPDDDSALAQQALSWAELLAARGEAELFLLAVVEPLAGISSPLPAPTVRATVAKHQQVDVEAATARLSNELHRLHGRGIQASRFVSVGAPALRILEFIDEHRIELVVMGTHGRGGLRRAVLGSVADEVRRRSSVPTLLVPAEGSPPIGALSILVCLDESDGSEAALDAALMLAQNAGGSLILLTVIAPSAAAEEDEAASTYLARASEAATALGIHASTVVRRGHAGTEILGTAAALRADVIAIASHGRSAVARAVLGSVASQVAEHANLPLLLNRRRPE